MTAKFGFRSENIQMRLASRTKHTIGMAVGNQSGEIGWGCCVDSTLYVRMAILKLIRLLIRNQWGLKRS